MNNLEQITCPSCNHEFDVEQAISSKMKAAFESQFAEKQRNLEKAYAAKNEALRKQREAVEKSKEHIDDLVQEQLKLAKKQAEITIRARVQDEVSLELKDLQSENTELKTAKQKFQEEELQLRKDKRKLVADKEQLELEVEKKLAEGRRKIKLEVQEKAASENEMKLQEKQIVIDQLEGKVKEMTARIEQGSVQAQGEAQELVIEEYLRSTFATDIISEVPKGKKGADCILTVRNEDMTECGRIIVESKRTKQFNKEWIKKIKLDTLSAKGNLSIIVTETLPTDVEKVAIVNGVWITDMLNFSEVIYILRKSLMREAKIADQQIDRTDKMELMYEYLTSDEFHLRVTTIINVFQSVKENIERQRTSMNSHWSKQLKELDKVIDSTGDMYGSVRGLSEGKVKTIPYLELDEDHQQLDQAG